MDTKIKDSLVMTAFSQAVGLEHPQERLIVHTDRGSQYTSQRFQSLLLRYSCKQSMSRKGNPYNCIGAFAMPERSSIPEMDVLIKTRKGVALSYSQAKAG